MSQGIQIFHWPWIVWFRTWGSACIEEEPRFGQTRIRRQGWHVWGIESLRPANGCTHGTIVCVQLDEGVAWIDLLGFLEHLGWLVVVKRETWWLCGL